MADPGPGAGAATPEPVVRLPAAIRAGEPFEVRAIIPHPMEHGRRRDAFGRLVPRRIINRFACTFDGAEVCSMDLGTGVAENPYVAFFVRVPGPGELRLEWRDDDGSVYAATRRIEPIG